MSKPWWWLSFADGDKPKGQQFLGAAIVQGDDMGEAVSLAHFLDINPGGDVMGFQISEDAELKDDQINRLLSLDDMKTMGMGPVRMNGEEP